MRFGGRRLDFGTSLFHELAMRITGGRARGIPLRSTDAPQLRPATDRMREAVFSSLGERVQGARTLDLFAGTGAYGLEALSRGAAFVTFVERERSILGILRANIAAVEKSLQAAGPATAVEARDALSYTGGSGYDLIFADPPYALFEEQREAFLTLAERLAAPGEHRRLIVEMPGGLSLDLPGWQEVRRLGKGRHDPSVGLYAPSAS